MGGSFGETVMELARVLGDEDLSAIGVAERFGKDGQDLGPYVQFQFGDDAVRQAQVVKNPVTRAVAHIRLDLAHPLAVGQLEASLGRMAPATGDDRFREIRVLEFPATSDSVDAVTVLAYVTRNGVERVTVRVDRSS